LRCLWWRGTARHRLMLRWMKQRSSQIAFKKRYPRTNSNNIPGLSRIPARSWQWWYQLETGRRTFSEEEDDDVIWTALSRQTSSLNLWINRHLQNVQLWFPGLMIIKTLIWCAHRKSSLNLVDKSEHEKPRELWYPVLSQQIVSWNFQTKSLVTYLNLYTVKQNSDGFKVTSDRCDKRIS
jgi:hypothetical protein